MELTDAVTQLGALAHESRLSLFRLLVRRGDAGLPAGEIAERQGIAAPNASFHLTELQRAGLLRSRREGRSVIYSIHFQAIQRLVDYLRENCCAEEGCETVISTTSIRRKK